MFGELKERILHPGWMVRPNLPSTFRKDGPDICCEIGYVRTPQATSKKQMETLLDYRLRDGFLTNVLELAGAFAKLGPCPQTVSYPNFETQ